MLFSPGCGYLFTPPPWDVSEAFSDAVFAWLSRLAGGYFFTLPPWDVTEALSDAIFAWLSKLAGGHFFTPPPTQPWDVSPSPRDVLTAVAATWLTALLLSAPPSRSARARCTFSSPAPPPSLSFHAWAGQRAGGSTGRPGIETGGPQCMHEASGILEEPLKPSPPCHTGRFTGGSLTETLRRVSLHMLLPFLAINNAALKSDSKF